MKIKHLFTALFISFITHAQNNDVYKDIYPKDDAITVLMKQHIEISENRGKLSIREFTSKTDLFLTNNHLALASEKISYNTFNSILNIEAYTQNPDQNNTVKTFTDKDVLINGIFFNDQKEKSFTFPNIKKGSLTHLNYTREIKDPHFIPPFFAGKNKPIVNAEFSISFPNSVNISYKSLNLDSTNTQFEILKKKDNTTYKWILKSIPKISRHYDFSASYYIPQIIPFIKSFSYNGTTKSVLSNSSDLYLWYKSLIANINKTNQSELKTTTLNLIKDLETDEEKIKRIYYYVQNEINYIAFEDGLNGFVPRDAENTFSKKYGDCKDMANLLNVMLRYAGIKSHLVWIGTRSKPYSYSDVPTPIVDNHMITAVEIDCDYIFLDATAKYLTFNYPSPFIQGKEALIGVDNENFKIIRVPEVEHAKNNITIYSNLKLENNVLIGKHKAQVSGYDKLEFLHRFETKKNEDRSFLYEALNFGNKKTGFDSISYNNVSLENDSLTINFKSNTRDYSRIIDNKTYLSLNLDFNLKSEMIKNEKKNFDKKINYKYEKNFISTFEIPENFAIESIPESTKFNNESFGFFVSYELSDDKKTVTLRKNITINSLKIETQEVEDWNGFIKSLNKTNRQAIVLIEI